ncbi:MAG: M1 family metallopeptidase [Microthrixaceae bacterium]
MTRPSRLLLLLGCVALVAGTACEEEGDTLVGSSASSDAVVADPYFPGLGDPRYDVTAYDLVAAATIDGTDHLDATMTITAVAVATLAELALDLDGFEVGEVLVDGVAAATRRTDTKLIVVPATPIGAGATFTVVVPYAGTPGGTIEDPDRQLEQGGGWVDLDDYSAVLAQPIGARTWIPVNDLTSDKATVRVAMTVPSPSSAVSNGRLVERRDDPATGTSTSVWATSEPIAPYLITMAIGEYRLIDRAPIGSAVVVDAAPPDELDLADSAFADFGAMAAWFATRFGPYPFADAGNVVVPDLPPTAFESQTRSIFSDDTLDDDETEELVAHELAHQWFGNAVTPASWTHLWLNEGPAVHAQWSWTEHTGGQSVLESALESWDPDDPDLDVPPADPGVAQLFGTSVYVRSALFLVELQLLMGEEPFDQLLRTWVDQHRFGTGTTEQFVDLASTVHGSSIEELSDPWLHDDELPELSFDEDDL